MMIPFGENAVDAMKVVFVGSTESVCICQYGSNGVLAVAITVFGTHREAKAYVQEFMDQVNAARRL